MELAENIKSAIATWFAQGASLDEIQKRLSAEHDLHLTYLDLRLIVAELPQPEEPAGEEAPAAGDVPEASPQEDSTALPPEEEPLPEEGQAAPCTLSVTVDPITPPGVMAGGGVTFSDGTSGKWYLDQMGRLGLSDLPAGYRPQPQDAALFQSRLMEALQAKGLM